MTSKGSLSVRGDAVDLSTERKGDSPLDILVVLSPLLIVGGIGEWIGDGTELGAVLINVAYVLCILFATAVLKRRGSGWREIGLVQPDKWGKTVLLAIATLVGYYLAIFMAQALLQLVPGLELAPSDQSSFNPLTGNLPLFLLYTVAAWTTIAFGEEMLFRAFLMNSLAGLLGGRRARWALALIGSALLFGSAHFSWGLAGIIENTVLGLVLGFFYLRSGRNLWVTIIAHGIGNTLAFFLIYIGAA